MKIRRAGIAGVALVAVLGLAACSSDSDSTADETTPAATESASPEATAAGTVPEVAAEAGNFTTLVDAVTAAGLGDTLSTEEVTVFAPTDEAFAKDVPEATLTTLLEDPQGDLTSILTYHV
ncbi:MAG: fasciclin domain-containing protein, partial [Fuerstiella sp.]|nr:fasciclin domain-containing protein [Fuerstiella sp.]